MRSRLLCATALTTTILFLVPGISLAQSAYNWTGRYVGASIGVVESTSTETFTYSGTPGLPGSIDLSGSGLAGTLDAGYNLQTGSVVFGLEGDITGLARKDSGLSSGANSITVNGTVDMLLTARGRLGISMDKLLIYGTAGLAAGHGSVNTDFGKGSSDGSAAALLGYAGGLGVEYALNDNMSLKAEGLYYHLGSLTTAGTASSFSSPSVTYSGSYNPSGALFRAGLNIHF